MVIANCKKAKVAFTTKIKEGVMFDKSLNDMKSKYFVNAQQISFYKYSDICDDGLQNVEKNMKYLL